MRARMRVCGRIYLYTNTETKPSYLIGLLCTFAEISWLRRQNRSKSMMAGVTALGSSDTSDSNSPITPIISQPLSNDDVTVGSTPAQIHMPASAPSMPTPSKHRGVAKGSVSAAPMRVPLRKPAAPPSTLAPNPFSLSLTTPLTPISSSLFEKAMREADALSAEAVELAHVSDYFFCL